MSILHAPLRPTSVSAPPTVQHDPRLRKSSLIGVSRHKKPEKSFSTCWKVSSVVGRRLAVASPPVVSEAMSALRWPKPTRAPCRMQATLPLATLAQVEPRRWRDRKRHPRRRAAGDALDVGSLPARNPPLNCGSWPVATANGTGDHSSRRCPSLRSLHRTHGSCRRKVIKVAERSVLYRAHVPCAARIQTGWKPVHTGGGAGGVGRRAGGAIRGGADPVRTPAP